MRPLRRARAIIRSHSAVVMANGFSVTTWRRAFRHWRPSRTWVLWGVMIVTRLTPDLAKQLGVPDTAGLAVGGVKDGSPAAEAGLRSGDVIVQVNQKPVATIAELRQALATRKAGEPTLLLIHRRDASLFVAIQAPGKSQG